MINIRDKGQNGEREIAQLMNGIVILAMKELGFPQDKITAAALSIQRNQNQSAVGGNDLSNTWGLSIEIKRQEQLSINSWWAQCVAAAGRNLEHPVLLFKQNHRPWRCITMGGLRLPGGEQIMLERVEIDYHAFQKWFRNWVLTKLRQGEAVRV